MGTFVNKSLSNFSKHFQNFPKMIDSDLARQLFEHGAVLIIAGVPNGTEFSMDCSKNVVAERFRGVKMIPPGPHFVSCASRGPYGDVAPKVGFIHYYRQQEIIIREWNEDTEELNVRTKGDSEMEKQRIRDNLKDLDVYLAPYDYSTMAKWKAHSEFISECVVNRLSPANGIIRNCVDLLSCPDSERPRGHGVEIMSPVTRRIKQHSTYDEDELLPDLKPIPGTASNYTQLPERCPKTASPQEVSQHHLDSISAVDELLARFESPEELLGEIQFAFVSYFAGGSLDGLAHWRKVLLLLAHSETATQKHAAFYRQYLKVLTPQIPELPEELMTPSAHNTVYQDTRTLLANCSASGLTDEVDQLQKRLKRTLMWVFDGLLEEDPEDLPVVVET